MTLYFYRGNHGLCRDGKLHAFYCNECGSFDLEYPRMSESDHRDVLRFSCKNCGYQPYWGSMHVSDIIEVTNENKDEIRIEFVKQIGKDPDKYKWRFE